MAHMPEERRRVPQPCLMSVVRRRRRTDVGRYEWALRSFPQALIEYPAEVLLMTWALLSGPAVLLGLSSPSSLDLTLPNPGPQVWAGFLTAAGLLIGTGLWRKSYGGLVAIGLRMLGTASLVYSIAILFVLGVTGGIPAGPLLTAIALLCWFRSWWLRERRRIVRQQQRSEAETAAAVGQQRGT